MGWLILAGMSPTPVKAICCAVSDKPGVANVTSLSGHLPEKLKCAECGKEYSVDFDMADLYRIVDYAKKLAAAARRAVNESHPAHGNYININEVEGEPLAAL
jgi:hypothetical protein